MAQKATIWCEANLVPKMDGSGYIKVSDEEYKTYAKLIDAEGPEWAALIYRDNLLVVKNANN